MDERKNGVKVNRELPVWRRNEEFSTHPQDFGDESLLGAAVADMFDYRRAEDNVELLVGEGKTSWSDLCKPQPRIALFEKCRILDARGSDTVLIGIKTLKEVGLGQRFVR